MPLYTVGDRVRVRTDLYEDDLYGGMTFTKRMLEYRGRIVVIRRINAQGSYCIEGDDRGWHFTDAMLEPVENTNRVAILEKKVEELLAAMANMQQEIEYLKAQNTPKTQGTDRKVVNLTQVK